MQRGAAKRLEGRAIAGDSPVAVGHAAFLVTVREYRGTRETPREAGATMLQG
jgi:hypothetical protein